MPRSTASASSVDGVPARRLEARVLGGEGLEEREVGRGRVSRLEVARRVGRGRRRGLGAAPRRRGRRGRRGVRAAVDAEHERRGEAVARLDVVVDAARQDERVAGLEDDGRDVRNALDVRDGEAERRRRVAVAQHRRREVSRSDVVPGAAPIS